MSQHHHRHDGAHPHGHAHAHAGNERRVFWALLLTAGFVLVEVAGGILSGSLTLLADAGHMLTDTAALGLTWHAFRISRQPATPARSYGHDRAQVLAALINGGTLVAISAWIVVEAVQRLLAPVQVLGGAMLAVAVVGLVVNLAAWRVLSGGSEGNLNIHGAVLHVLSDLVGSAAAILAAGIILLTGWTPVDPLLSMLVALLILRSAWMLVARSWHVLMEGTPEGLDVAALRAGLVEAVPGVTDVHHVHAWCLTPERPLITLHANIAEDADHDSVLHRLQATLAERFAIDHATIQIERNRCTDRHRGREPRSKEWAGEPQPHEGDGLGDAAQARRLALRDPR
jgi:cobalt-zinc-cadmium efflux system protein